MQVDIGGQFWASRKAPKVLQHNVSLINCSLNNYKCHWKKHAQCWWKDPRIWLHLYAQVLNVHLELNINVLVVLKWNISLVYKHTHVPPAEVLGRKWFLLEMEVVNSHCISRHGSKEAREMAQRGKANVLNMHILDNSM